VLPLADFHGVRARNFLTVRDSLPITSNVAVDLIWLFAASLAGKLLRALKHISITHPAVWASIPQRCRASVSLSKGKRMSAAAFPKVGLEAMLTPDNCVPVLIDHQPFQVAAVLLLHPEWPAATGQALSDGASA
jgi:hypothetical protein